MRRFEILRDGKILGEGVEWRPSHMHRFATTWQMGDQRLSDASVSVPELQRPGMALHHMDIRYLDPPERDPLAPNERPLGDPFAAPSPSPTGKLPSEDVAARVAAGLERRRVENTARGMGTPDADANDWLGALLTVLDERLGRAPGGSP